LIAMKKLTDKKLAVVTATVRTLSAQELLAIQGGSPPDPCRTPIKSPSGG
jgi:hypothetical protein